MSFVDHVNKLIKVRIEELVSKRYRFLNNCVIKILTIAIKSKLFARRELMMCEILKRHTFRKVKINITLYVYKIER